MGMPKYAPVISNSDFEEGSAEVFLERKVGAYFLLWLCQMIKKQIIKMVMLPALIPAVGKKGWSNLMSTTLMLKDFSLRT